MLSAFTYMHPENAEFKSFKALNSYTILLYTNSGRQAVPPAGPQGRHPAHGAPAPRSQAAPPPRTRRERAVPRSSLPSQIHCSPSSDGSMGIPPAPRLFGPGPPQPARLSRPTRRRRHTPFCPLRPVSRTLVPATLKRLRRSGSAAGAARQRLRRGASRPADQSLSGPL